MQTGEIYVQKTWENCAHGYENTCVLRIAVFVPLT